MKTDLDFMKEAYQQALRAYKIDEVPIGAILVDEQGKVVARGYNQVEKKQSGQAHAEMLALDKAARIKNNWRLSSLTLYVTLQPCLMCLGALYLSRVSRVVYGVISEKYGVLPQQVEHIGLYQNLHTTMEFVHYEPSKKLLQLFFQKKRSVGSGKQSGFDQD